MLLTMGCKIYSRTYRDRDAFAQSIPLFGEHNCKFTTCIRVNSHKYCSLQASSV